MQHLDTVTLSDVIVAILDSRASFPLAAAAALVRERDGEHQVIHLVLLGEDREPMFTGAGTMIGVTYAAGCLDKDLLAAFGDKQIIVLT